MDKIYNIKDYFDFEAWKNWYISFVIDFPDSYSQLKRSKDAGKNGDLAESLALEVLYYRKKLEHFAG